MSSKVKDTWVAVPRLARGKCVPAASRAAPRARLLPSPLQPTRVGAADSRSAAQRLSRCAVATRVRRKGDVRCTFIHLSRQAPAPPPSFVLFQPFSAKPSRHHTTAGAARRP
eukprot:354473-Chlamydomonas_euryale.AAC.1